MKKLILAVLFGSAAFAITPPTLPQYQVDSSVPTVTGKSTPVASGSDLQAAINAANPGDELVLQAGGSWTGNYMLPNKGANSAWITLRSSAMGSLPTTGNRVAPKDAVNMPKIMAAGTDVAFKLATGANHYRLMGLEITEQPKQALNYGLIMEGDPNDTNAADLPSYFTVDRCYIHGLVLSHIKFGVQLNGSYIAVVDSYLSEFHGLGQDTQALFGYMGTGPYKIVNNFLEGSGENILFGGAWDAIPNTISADATIQYNYFYKPLAWMNTIIPAPSLSGTVSLGGTLAPNTYYYAVIAAGTCGTLTDPGSCQGARSNELKMTLGAGQNAVNLQWPSVSYGDTSDTRTPDVYVIARTTDAPGITRNWTYYQVTTNSFTDTGTATALSSYNEWPRAWEVKNLFEIKNGTRMLVDHNLFEGNWLNAQNGLSVLFTPRNETPYMSGNHISDISFTNNVMRHVSGLFNIGSEDSEQSADELQYMTPTSRIKIAGNLFDDVSTTKYGGMGIFLQIGPGTATLPGAQDISVTHNTVLQPGNAGNFGGMASGTNQIGPFEHKDNILNNGPYGWHIDSYGALDMTLLQQQFTSITNTNNVRVAEYPVYAGDFVPADWNSVGFVNYNNGNGGDYHLASSSAYKGKASDGTDPGANIDVLNTVIQNAMSGVNPNAVTSTGSSTGSTSTGGTGSTSTGSTSGSTSPTGSTGGTTTSTSGGTTTQPNLTYVELVNTNSQKCVTMQPDWTLLQNTCTGANTQLFTLIPQYTSMNKLQGYELLNPTGQHINVWGSATVAGSVIGVYAPYSGTANEIYGIVPSNQTQYTIHPNHSWMCMDINAASTADGAKVQEWTCNGTSAQTFNLVQVQ